MDQPPIPDPPAAAAAIPRRSAVVTAWAVVAIALVGFLVGAVPAQPGWVRPRIEPVAAIEDSPQPAPRYLEIVSRTRGPNAGYSTDLRALVSRVPDLDAPVVNTPEQRAATQARRALRRAYHGAPPTIPHKTDANDVETCYLCHGEGREIDGVVAPRISHARFVNCTQCHAQAGTPGLGPELPVANQGIGLQAPTQGIRAYPGAPPQIPHAVHMRENCIACHGTLGHGGLRSTHPWRVNCLQCHAASADYDQRHFAEAAFPAPALAPPR